jgi:rRNA maturation protein Nop10
MKGLAPVYSYSEKCEVKGRKTGVHNPDKLEEAGTPYVWRVMLVPLV